MGSTVRVYNGVSVGPMVIILVVVNAVISSTLQCRAVPERVTSVATAVTTDAVDPIDVAVPEGAAGTGTTVSEPIVFGRASVDVTVEAVLVAATSATSPEVIVVVRSVVSLEVSCRTTSFGCLSKGFADAAANKQMTATVCTF